MAAANVQRYARTALMDVYKAERSWDGWNDDGVGVANQLANLLLQLRNSQESAVWHPSILSLFPDLPSKYMAAALDTSKSKLKQLRHIITMMFEEPFVLNSLQRYSELTRVVCDVYRNSVSVREEHIQELEQAIESFEGATDAPTGSLDSDTQMVRLSTWLHSPGLKNAILLDRASTPSTLMLSDFDDMLRAELGIDEM
ncbi:hypothetical protein GGI12_003493 [Dipsacomyces acuminosporus]|nr:hypothetical protein GGI12_003493 [Dipsacomyces acuminosporus]